MDFRHWFGGTAKLNRAAAWALCKGIYGLQKENLTIGEIRKVHHRTAHELQGTLQELIDANLIEKPKQVTRLFNQREKPMSGNHCPLRLKILVGLDISKQ